MANKSSHSQIQLPDSQLAALEAHLAEKVERQVASATSKIVERTIMKSFSDPLPEPEMLKHYNEVLPGLGDKIVDMAQREQDTRIYEVERIHRFRFLGLCLGFILAAGFLVGGFVLFYNDKQTAGWGMLGAGTAMILGALFGRRKTSDKSE